MAKTELDILLNKLQGRLTGDSEFYVSNRYGKPSVPADKYYFTLRGFVLAQLSKTPK